VKEVREVQDVEEMSATVDAIFVARGFTVCGKSPNTVILSPPRRAKNPSWSFVLNQEGFFASLRVITKVLFPQPVRPRHLRTCILGL
jgi:hypothetical protein